MTKETRIKELLDRYEDEQCTLRYEYDTKTNDLILPFDDDATEEMRKESDKKEKEIIAWYNQELIAIKQRFINALMALEE